MKGLCKIYGCLTLWILGSLILPGILLPQENSQESGPGLSISLDRESAHVGEILLLSLGHRLPNGALLDTPPEIKGLEDLSILDIKTGPGKIDIKILIDKLGSWKTGTLSLFYLDKDGNQKALTADPVSVSVLSNLGEKPEEAQLRPIQGIIPARPLWLKALPWAAASIMLMVAAFGVIWWYRRRRQKVLSLTPYDPPHILAINRIKKLEEEKVFERGHVKAFYFHFSEILRQYLESIRGFPAAEYTTEEIVSHIKSEQDRCLVPLLRHADLVKFADSIPTQAGKEEEVRTALMFINQTSPHIETGNQKETDGGTS